MWKAFLEQTTLKAEHFIFVLFAIILVIVLIPVFTYAYFANAIKDKQSIVNSNNTGVILLDATGHKFYSFNNPKSITYVPLSAISQHVQDAVVASEDKKFYTNTGFSATSIIRAFYLDIIQGDYVQGGSTITQQLVKTALLNSQKNFLRKYQEVVLAYELYRRYSKQDVLEMYLNSVYFGEGAFGIENASQTYFGIHANKLSLAQSALLIGLLPAPSDLSPISHTDAAARNRQEIVLQQMVITGVITQEQADAAFSEKLSYEKQQVESAGAIAPHFALYVLAQLKEKYSDEDISRSGFVVKTTMRQDWQEYAQNVVKQQVQQLAYDHVTNGAAVVMDPKTGEIEAMVGSVDWNNETFGKVNMTLTPRQPGSSFKPIIYADALEKQTITLATILDDQQTTFPGNYIPHDFDNRYRGPVTVRRALANSLNIPAVSVLDKVGLSDAITFTKSLGITTIGNESDYGLSYVLGTAEAPLLELTNVYGTFANGGQQNEPTTILEIRDKYNKVIYSYTPSNKQTISAGASFLISSTLSDNNTRAEEFGDALTIYRPAAVKTGTTDDFKDSLTIGYTPQIVIGVWVGNNDHSAMDNIAGSLGAAPIWRQLTTHFLQEYPYEAFSQPPSVIDALVCPVTTTVDVNNPFPAYMEFFIQNTETPFLCETPTPISSSSANESPTAEITP